MCVCFVWFSRVLCVYEHVSTYCEGERGRGVAGAKGALNRKIARHIALKFEVKRRRRQHLRDSETGRASVKVQGVKKCTKNIYKNIR